MKLSYDQIRNFLLSGEFEYQNIEQQRDMDNGHPCSGNSVIDRIVHSTATDEEKEMLYNLYLLRRMYSIHPIYTRLAPRKILKSYFLTPLSIAKIRDKEGGEDSSLTAFVRKTLEFSVMVFLSSRILGIARGVPFNFNYEARNAILIGFAFQLAIYAVDSFKGMSRPGVSEINYHRKMIKALESTEKQLFDTINHLRKRLPSSILVDYDELNKDLSEINYSTLWGVNTESLESFHSRLCSYEELLRSKAHFELG